MPLRPCRLLAPWLAAAAVVCTLVACHGSQLQGGRGPSCTSCHRRVW